MNAEMYEIGNYEQAVAECKRLMDTGKDFCCEDIGAAGWRFSVTDSRKTP